MNMPNNKINNPIIYPEAGFRNYNNAKMPYDSSPKYDTFERNDKPHNYSYYENQHGYDDINSMNKSHANYNNRRNQSGMFIYLY